MNFIFSCFMRRWRGHYASLLLLFSVLVICSKSVADDMFFDDVDVDDNSIDLSASDKKFKAIGSITQRISYGLDAPGQPFSRDGSGMNQLKTVGFTQFDWKPTGDTVARLSVKASLEAIYKLEGEDNYNDNELDEHQERIELRDAFIETQLNDNWYIKVGNQIVAWGQAEDLRINDLINTQDQITIGQQNLEDIRLPVPAIQSTHIVGSWIYKAVATFRAGSDELASNFSEFDTLIRLRESDISIHFLSPKQKLEYFFRASTQIKNGDISFVASDVNSNSYYTHQTNRENAEVHSIDLYQDRFQAVGVDGAMTQGSWLYFGELGVHFDKQLFLRKNRLFHHADGWLETDQLLSAFGFGYSGGKNLSVASELNYTNVLNHRENASFDHSQFAYSIRANWTGMRDALALGVLWRQIANQNGRIFRLSCDYDWSDSVETGFLLVEYYGRENQALFDFRNSDAIQFYIKYSFQK